MINTVLITGCTRGLGRELAKNLASKGYCVYAVGRTQDELVSLSQEFPTVVTIHADIASAAGRKLIFDALSDKEASISIIHNASIASPEIFSELSEEMLRQHMETNCIAPLLLTQILLPLLKNGQRILNISSGAASMPLPGLLPYCISKAAIQHAMTCLNKEFNGEVLFGNIRPGLMDTTMVNDWFELDASKLPQIDYYQQAKDTNQMVSPALAAKFITWVLMNTNNHQFSETAWNIYDEEHHIHWLSENELKPKIPNMNKLE